MNTFLRYFTELSAIPRTSGHEKAAADWVQAFAAERGLACVRDGADNVLIRRPASGCSSAAPVLLQGHLDMVGEKLGASSHDFLTDGIPLRQDGDWLSADGTTLGGDDGAAVALMLSLLDDETLVSPPLECLFTTSEETGMSGARAFDASLLTARRMVNLDSETPDEVCVSCAGGVKHVVTIPVQRYPAPPLKAVTITVDGLAGGHSGVDIHRGRGSSLLLTGRILAALYELEPFQLISFSGGDKSNAIPRECVCRITAADPDAVTETVKKMTAVFRHELTGADRRLRIRVGKGGAYENTVSFADTHKIIDFLQLVPNGVMAMTPGMDSLVACSSSLGIARLEEGAFTAVNESRAGDACRMDMLVSRFDALAHTLGASVEHRDRYPGWPCDPDSPLLRRWTALWKEQTGNEPKVVAIHAGLECGLLKGAVPDLDIISVGPLIENIHTPQERMSLSSCDALRQALVRLLEQLAREVQ